MALGLVVVPARVGTLEHDHVDGGELGGVAEPVEPLGVPVPGRHRHHQPGHDRGGGGQGGLDRAEGGRDVAVVHVHLEVDGRQLVGPPEGVGAAQPGGVDPGQRRQRSVQQLDDLLAPHGNLSEGRDRRYSLPQAQPARRAPRPGQGWDGGGTMIARIWKGAVRKQDGDAYARYMQGTGVAGYARSPGNRGVWMLRRDVDDRTEFVMLTLWDSLEAVKAFAGDDHETAVFYPEDDRFLVERDLTAAHYEVDTQVGPEVA
ncbi:MAG: antibiotic biosynthesis monooxygenase family protein [Actinomycetes bacterium]